MNNGLDIIVTLNHHLLGKETLQNFIEHGATHFRINGSHVLPEDVPQYTKAIKNAVGDGIKILLDLPGNKIRTNNILQPIVLKAGKEFDLRADQFNYPGFISFLKPDDQVLANDSRYLFTVKQVQNHAVTFVSKTDGQLFGNKGVHLTRSYPDLPILFERDLQLIEQAKKYAVTHLGVSFVRTAEDVRAVRQEASSNLELVVKIETAKAIENLDEILNEAEEFLVDRGDLSCDVGLETIERYQKQILHRAKQKGKKIFFATQFLTSMVESETPLIAEVSALADAFNCGVHGIQLSEETAIGKNPFAVLKFMHKVYKYRRPLLKWSHNHLAPVLWLTGPSGAGKTTLATQLADKIEQFGYHVCLIDGDEYRKFFGDSLGYTEQDRILNQKSISFTAHESAKSFDVVIVASLSPYAKMRNFARERIGNFHEVYLKCSLDACKKRDPKGLYQKSKMGEVKNFLDEADNYEVPERPELVVNTEILEKKECLNKILEYLFEGHYGLHF